MAPPNERKRGLELSWGERSQIIFFHLHPLLGCKELKRTSTLFGINIHTLSSWLTNKRMIPKWFNTVGNMEAGNLIESLPTHIQLQYENVPARSKVDLRRFECIMTAEVEEEKEIDVLNLNSFGSSMKYFVPYEEETPKTSSKRVCLESSGSLGRKRSYVVQEEFILRTLRDRVENGDPMSKKELRDMVVAHAMPGSLFYMKLCDTALKNYPNYLNKFITRVVERGQFVLKKKIIVEKVPTEWRGRVEGLTTVIRQRFAIGKMNACIAMEPLHLRVRLQDATYMGVTVFLAMEGLEGIVLPPIYVFSGGEMFNTLSRAVFSENQWLDGSSVLMWMETVRQLFPERNVGMLLSATCAHTSPNLMTFAQEQPNWMIEHIPTTLMHVYHPIQLGFVKEVKTSIASTWPIWKRTMEHENMSLHHGLMLAVDRAVEEVWESGKTTQSWSKAFKRCGVVPFAETSQFDQHLDNLSVNTIYDRMLSEGRCLELQ